MKKKKIRPLGIQVTITASFTAAAMAIMLLLSLLMYAQFASRMEQNAVENGEQLIGQTVINLEDYLRNMRRISDAIYYGVIKDTDLGEASIAGAMELLYETNVDELVSIACFDTKTGQLIDASPVANTRSNLELNRQDWFSSAVAEPENFHFSYPHVQNLYDDSSYRYHWVISLSRSVELTKNGVAEEGVLLVDMNYSSIVNLLRKANKDENGYLYLCGPDGEIIYHPHQELIRSGHLSENTQQLSAYDDGTHKEVFQGEERLVTVKTVAYTGWKLVRVVPREIYGSGLLTIRYLVMLLLSAGLLIIFLLNQVISSRLTLPLRKLNDSVNAWEAGTGKADIYVGGSTEVEHLGKTLGRSIAQSEQLMKDIVVEQEEKRKSELDALQSQINPHFLYNTLDSIIWMINGEKYDEAVFMIKQLASLFRISLSKGYTIISLADEVKHAQHYMNIQKVRYKNDFSVTFAIAEEVLDCCTVKLIIQPLLENAIYYGMEYMDDEGEIEVKGYREGDDIYIDVKDNGPGLKEEEAERLLTDSTHKHTSGSGVGLINVHNRIRLRFGEQYGLSIDTHPDEGMLVRIHIPYVPYTPENRDLIEKGHYYETE